MRTAIAFLLLCSPVFGQYLAANNIVVPPQMPYTAGIPAASVGALGGYGALGGALGGYGQLAVDTSDAEEIRLADLLAARFLARQAEVLRLQTQAASLEVNNQRIRAYICSRICGVPTPTGLGVPPIDPARYLPTTPLTLPPQTVPLAYPTLTNSACGTPQIQVGVGVGGLRYPW